MKLWFLATSILFTLTLATSGTTFAGDFTASCDARASNKDQCVEWMSLNLKSMGCAVTSPKCVLHSWGSDFVKSWICTVTSAQCEPISQGANACMSGSIHVFKSDWDACLKITKEPKKFTSECRHENASHGLHLDTCAESQIQCEKFGGFTDSISVSCQKGDLQKGDVKEAMDVTTGASCEQISKKCTDMKGALLSDWSVTCRFRDIRIEREGASCDELQKRCEQGNSPNGPKGVLRACTVKD